jgi:hypothetical protein
MSWLNTNTVQGRFDLIVARAVPEVLHDELPAARPADIAGETPQALRPRVRVGNRRGCRRARARS